jgi:hypothetical protein
MIEAATLTPSNWESFYVILGSSSAALIGLQFVVITLVAERRAHQAEHYRLSAFATPTVVHFAGALLVSAAMTTPWPSPMGVGIALVVCGIGGMGYGLRVILRALRQKSYKPVWEDWLWHVVLPDLAYITIAVGGRLVYGRATVGPFAVACGGLALFFIGIHNPWDTVTYIVTSASDDDAAEFRNL